MWPFSKPKQKPDNRPPTVAAKAVAESLANQPERWKPHGSDYLVHDTGVVIDTDGWIRTPDTINEPDANGDLVCEAIEIWIAKRMESLPPPAVKEPIHDR